MIAGYTQSKEFLETSGPEQVNENQRKDHTTVDQNLITTIPS